MMVKMTPLLLLMASAGCIDQDVNNPNPDRNEIYALVVSHLAHQQSEIPMLKGTMIWIAPEFAEGDSLFYGGGVGTELELQQAMRDSSKDTSEFPTEEVFGPDGKVTVIESFNDLYYYGKGRKLPDAKCLVKFWRPGFTVDGKRAIVRFYCGPSAHGAAGTYVLQLTKHGWE